jgi:sugar-specific transcriptional regulator TrmB
MTLKKHIISLLLRAGLTESEAHLYLAANQNPNLTLKELKKITGYSLASVYRAFDHLKELGFITSSLTNWRKNIEAVSLKVLAEKVSKEQRKLRKIELELKKLNNLMSLNLQDEEMFQIFSEKNQILEKNFEILRHPLDNFCVYGSAERLIDVLGYDYERTFVRMRNKQGKGVKAFMTEYGPYGQECVKKGDLEMRDTKLSIDPNMQDFMSYIYDNEVTIWYRDQECGNKAFVIKDPSMVKMQRNIFDSLWNKPVANQSSI